MTNPHAAPPRGSRAPHRAGPPGERPGPVTRWFLGRLPRSDHSTLTHRNVYILPTRPGLMLGLTLLLLLVGSINYQLNLGYLLTFLLMGSALVGMHLAHANLRGLRLRLEAPEPGFAQRPARLAVWLDNPGPRLRPAIALGIAWSGEWHWTDLPPGSDGKVDIAWAPPSRGRHALPTLTAQTLFPLGTFRVWTHWRPAATLLAYPTPEPHPPPLPAGEPRPGGTQARQAAPSGEFEGVRPYRRGDPLKTVAWKKAAQLWAADRDELVSRDRVAHPQASELWLDLERCGLSQREAALSRLCAWVLAAEQRGLDYGLRLPGRHIPLGQGAQHQRHCLEALALC